MAELQSYISDRYLIARTKPVFRCVNRQTATKTLGLCVFAYIGQTCVMGP